MRASDNAHTSSAAAEVLNSRLAAHARCTTRLARGFHTDSRTDSTMSKQTQLFQKKNSDHDLFTRRPIIPLTTVTFALRQ